VAFIPVLFKHWKLTAPGLPGDVTCAHWLRQLATSLKLNSSALIDQWQQQATQPSAKATPPRPGKKNNYYRQTAAPAADYNSQLNGAGFFGQPAICRHQSAALTLLSPPI